ncbi:MAG TPA: P1 family peptidase [Gemmatimonadaceae bacterium]|nr:P1 family peptidase [Gemmatimonadaceae bacterium]
MPVPERIIIVVATDAPLLPHQLKRIARRAALGLARTGSIASNGSGDIFIAFSTANHGVASAPGTPQVAMVPNHIVAVRGDGPGHGGSDYQRADRGRDDDRRQRRDGKGHSARTGARDSEKVRSARGTVSDASLNS